MQSYRVHLLRPVLSRWRLPATVETASSLRRGSHFFLESLKCLSLRKVGHLRLRSHININLQVLVTVSVGKLTSA